MLKETKIERSKLLSTLKTNLEDHKEIHSEALRVWKNSYTKYVSKFASNVKKGIFNEFFNPPKKPTSYAKEYEDVISQLEYSADTHITLNNNEFKQFILDEWIWATAFYSPFTTHSSFQAANLSPSSLAKINTYSHQLYEEE